MSHQLPNKVLLIGCTGQLGTELRQRLSNRVRTLTTSRRATVGADLILDIADSAQVERCVTEIRPDVVINAAAYTQVDQAESETTLATAVNAEAPGNLAKVCERMGACLIHFSTDYVFDGQSRVPYRESDSVNPRTVYGSTKLAGERAIAEHCSRWFVFRTSWVFASHGHNFVRNIASRARTGQPLHVVDDQLGCPTSARHLAVAIDRLLESGHLRMGRYPDWHHGLYHLSASGSCSWYELARRIVERVNPSVDLKAVSSASYPTPAPRPAYSVLDCEKARQALGLVLPPWESGVDAVLADLEVSP